jgi:hypothetical protein
MSPWGFDSPRPHFQFSWVTLWVSSLDSKSGGARFDSLVARHPPFGEVFEGEALWRASVSKTDASAFSAAHLLPPSGGRTQGLPTSKRWFDSILPHHAALAQLVEHTIEDRGVPGSIPGGGTYASVAETE